MVYRFDEFEVDDRGFRFSDGGAPVQVEPKVLRLLIYLIANRNRLVRKQELLDAVWPDAMVTENALTRAIGLLRKALNEDSHVPRYIETVPTAGYRFIANVTAVEQNSGVGASSLIEPAAIPPAHHAGARRRRIWIPAVILLLLATAAGAYRFFFHRNGGETIDSVPVLPFVNASGDPNAEYLSDGITESLINSLSQLPNLRVMSRDTAFRFKGKETDPRTVGREMGVSAIFKGTVTQRGETLSISAELIRARDNSHIWGQQYDRKLTDVDALREEIAGEMASALRVRLTGPEERGLTKTYTANPEAYQDYLKGRYWWNKSTPDGFDKGIEYF
jgi:TolB-like protein/DNA-binding winged helix-turn-helix (wHTH) protein